MSPATAMAMKAVSSLFVLLFLSTVSGPATAQPMVCRGPEIKLEIALAEPPNDSVVQVVRKLDKRMMVTEVLHLEIDVQASGQNLVMMDKFLREAVTQSKTTPPREAAKGSNFALFYDSQQHGFAKLSGQIFEIQQCEVEPEGAQ